MRVSQIHRTVRGAVIAGLLAAASLAGGCGGSNFGSDLAVQPRARAINSVESVTLRLPQDDKFSLAVAPSEQKPGLDGRANAAAHASRDGSADAAADVQNGGSALGSFQLGHAFTNDTERQADYQFTVKFRYDYEATCEPPSTLPEASIGLMLYARDGRNRLVRSYTLVAYTSEAGPVKSGVDYDTRFTLTLAPRETVTVFLAGQAKIDVADKNSAGGKLSVSKLEMEIVTRPAPAVR